MNLDKGFYEQHIEPMCSHINVGSGHDLTIGELALVVKVWSITMGKLGLIRQT